MFRLVKRMFLSAIIFFSYNLLSVNPLECISISNQECKIRPEIVNVNSSEPTLYSFSITTSKCSGSCNNINNPYAKLSVVTINNAGIKISACVNAKN